MSAGSSFLVRLRNAAEIFESARKAAAAVDAGRRPPAKALRRLGIPESAFDTVRFL